MRVLISGANGFLGHYLTGLLLRRGHDVIATGAGPCRLPGYPGTGFIYEEMDFTDEPELSRVFTRYRPEFVIHAGARSKPDECELDRAKAFDCNVNGTRHLLAAAANSRAYFLFLSTDFIFDGRQGMYREDDLPGPVNYYGTTKLLAEEQVRNYPYDWGIARTVLVYGKPPAGRSNILTLVSDKLRRGEIFRVVNDQFRTPTYIEDLAGGLASMIEKKATGIYHLSGTDWLTPYEMAVKTAEYLRLDTSLLVKVTAADFPEPARRPSKTGFNIEKARRELGYDPVSFETGLRHTFS